MIKNIKQWFEKWISFYDTKCSAFRAEKAHIWEQISNVAKANVTINRGFLGYTLQSYISRKDAEGNVRTTQSYKRIIDNFAPEISNNLGQYRVPTIDTIEALNLGEIPHMFGILALSQYVNVKDTTHKA